MGALKTPKNLAQPKKRGKIKATPFLDAFEVSGSESEVRISIKILVLKLSNLMTLIVRNCSIKQEDGEVENNWNRRIRCTLCYYAFGETG